MTDIQEVPRPPEASLALRVAAMPWSFTQQYPLDTQEFIKEAGRLGFDLNHSILRELYRHKLLTPFVAIRGRRVGAPLVTTDPEPTYYGEHRKSLRNACVSGRAQDLSATPFITSLRFEMDRWDPFWWNGLLYSWYQLLSLNGLRSVLSRRKVYFRGGKRMVKLPKPGLHTTISATRLQGIAIIATALESRYLPILDPERVHLVAEDSTQWQRYVNDFNVLEMSQTLNYSAVDARRDAEYLLSRAHEMDPLGSSWVDLVKRAPRDSWESLKDTALLAMDLRQTAEILLRFYEDISALGHVETLPEFNQAIAWHPLVDRISSRRDTLDQQLMRLGISPHPRVVLAIEGDSEGIHAPRVWKTLDLPDLPELVRYLNLGGTRRDLQKVAALAAAPLIGAKHLGSPGSWPLIKPPSCLIVAADPENDFAPHNIQQTRLKILKEIKDVLSAQGAETNDSDLEALVTIHTWKQSCYEFAHFTDAELAEGIRKVHRTCNGWSQEELIGALAHWREKRKDIKRVWESGKWNPDLARPDGAWEYEVSKTKLSEALWPVLKEKVEQARLDSDVPMPEIAEVVRSAYHTAQGFRYGSFVLRAKE